MAAGLGRSIPLACQDWAATKAAYGFFSNERICEEQILAGHFQATRERLPQGEEPVLVLHDTTEFTYQREDEAAVGLLSKGSVRKDKQGQPVTVIEAREQQIPPDRDRIDWKLVTDLQVGSLDAAHREGAMVRVAMEDRDLSQDLEIGPSGRTGTSENHRPADQSARCLLHSRLARLLAHHDQSHRA